MAHEDDPELDPNTIDFDAFEDKIAARAAAYTAMVQTAADMKERGHDDLYDETMRMLQALRRSFKTLPTGEVAAIR